jgi:MoaA/NifB/PqqE/SkfB family radical SAM enzyme
MPPLDRLHIELTNVCNFKCEFCPDAIMERRRGHMSLALLEALLDDIATQQLTKILTFHLMGEPFIHPHIFDAIAMAVERSLPLHLTTNGSTFHLMPHHIKQLVHSGVPKVTISLQTPEPETFQLRGAPPRLTADAYFDGITRLVQTNLNTPSSSTRLHIKFLDTTPHPFLVPHKSMSVVANQQHMQAELTRWSELLLNGTEVTVDWEAIRKAIAGYRPGRWHLMPLHPKLVLETFPLDSWGNIETDEVYPAKFGYCNGATSQAGILHDGTVVPCCKDFEGQIPLGKVPESSLTEILQGPAACHLRQNFNRWQVAHPVCQRCMGADTSTKATLRQAGSIAYFKLYSPLMRRLYPGWGEV